MLFSVSARNPAGHPIATRRPLPRSTCTRPNRSTPDLFAAHRSCQRAAENCPFARSLPGVSPSRDALVRICFATLSPKTCGNGHGMNWHVSELCMGRLGQVEDALILPRGNVGKVCRLVHDTVDSDSAFCFACAK